jgi:hypothetical protein
MGKQPQTMMSSCPDDNHHAAASEDRHIDTPSAADRQRMPFIFDCHGGWIQLQSTGRKLVVGDISSSTTPPDSSGLVLR